MQKERINLEQNAKLLEKINRLKKERKAVILSHVYERPEVQDVADFVGDSLELSRLASKTDAQVIVFCGVHFMAESACILSPQKTVLLADIEAGCPMANMIDSKALRAKKEEIPGVQVVCYVNTSAEVKAESDIVCTSANAVKVINSLDKDRPILFVPDKNLGQYVAKESGRKDITFWEGCCYIHERLTKEEVLEAKKLHPNAQVLVHPECRLSVIELADKVASTTGMLRYVGETDCKEFIICTEVGLLHQFEKKYPERKFYEASSNLLCPDMKKTTLEKVCLALENMEPKVSVPLEIREKALIALERMLAL